MAKQRKKSNWMRHFVIEPRMTDTDLARQDAIRTIQDRYNKQIKRGRSCPR